MREAWILKIQAFDMGNNGESQIKSLHSNFSCVYMLNGFSLHVIGILDEWTGFLNHGVPNSDSTLVKCEI